MTETPTVLYGRTGYLGPDGEIISETDPATNLAACYEGCEAAGEPRPAAIIR